MDRFHGVTVVDFSRVMAGPYATVLLADLGARVIKVEPRDGDDYRHVGPWLGRRQRALRHGESRQGEHRARPQGRGRPRRSRCGSRDHADVVVENFRPGVADKLGIGADALTAPQPAPRVREHLRASARPDPMRAQPAYDIIVQALTGLMSITGDPAGSADARRRIHRRSGRRPLRLVGDPGGALPARAHRHRLPDRSRDVRRAARR